MYVEVDPVSLDAFEDVEATIEIGDTLLVRANLRSSDNRCQLPSAIAYHWENSAPTVVAIPVNRTAQELEAIALAPGVATLTSWVVRASRGSLAVTVVTGEPAMVAITAPSTTVAVGESLQLRATVKTAHGVTLPGAAVSWNSRAPGIAGVSADGLVQGAARGAVTITASSGTAIGSIQLEVVPSPIAVDRVEVTPSSASLTIGNSIQLSARALDAAGNVLVGRTVHWTSSNPGVAAVADSGWVTGVAPGSTSVNATVEGKTGSSSISVPAPGSGRYAYALVEGRTSLATFTPTHGVYNPAGPVTVNRLGTGQYQVQFHGLQPAAGNTQVFLVTNVEFFSVAAACKVQGVTTSQSAITASVSCYSTPGEVLTDQLFTILMIGSDALPGRLAFGWADQPSNEDPYTPSAFHNSSGQGLVVTRADNGIYTVRFTGNVRVPGGPPEIALVTATGSTGSRCTVNSRVIDEELHVHCVGGGANYFVDDDAPFMVAMLERGQPGRRFGFATVTDQQGILPGESFSSSGGAITARSFGPGTTIVRFADLADPAATFESETVQVVARSDLGDICRLSIWEQNGSELELHVECFDNNGAPVNREFRILVMQ
jgi:hypothetical protein